MQGIEAARRLFSENAAFLSEGRDIAPYVTAGLCGNGSDCFGYDDDISRDHDYEPGFCLWVDDSEYDRLAPILEDRYRTVIDSLPDAVHSGTSNRSDRRRGVFRTSDFYRMFIGTPHIPLSAGTWLTIPDYSLAAVTNGAVFTDTATDFTYYRNYLQNGCPEDIWLKKLAFSLWTMAQTGQYNYKRCLDHGEHAAACLALAKFAEAASQTVYYLNHAYPPYYKWLFRGIRDLEVLPELGTEIGKLFLPKPHFENIGMIEDICHTVIAELKKRELTSGRENFLEPHAFQVLSHIGNPILKRSVFITT